MKTSRETPCSPVVGAQCKVLLGLIKRIGGRQYFGFGGKSQKGEDTRKAAIRELEKE